MAVFILDDFDRVGQVLEDHAFFFRLFDFHHVSRHFILGSSVNVVNFLGSQSYSCSASVHGCVTTTDDRNLFAKFDFFVSYYLAQEVDTADHTVSIFALASNACGDPCADSQQNSIEVFTNCFKRDIYTDLSVCDDLHAHLFDGQDLFIQNFLRQSVFRDTVTEHSSSLRHGFEYSHIVTLLTQEICSRKSHRTTTDNCDSLAGCRFTFRNESFLTHQIVVSNESLQPLNGDRFVDQSSSALFFAWMRTNSSQCCRKRDLVLY